MRSHRPIRSRLAILSLPLVLAVTSCASDRDHVREETPPILVSRTGVPILMDLPVLGFLFCRTTVVR